MANVDTRLGRQSATCLLMPFMLIGVTPSTAGVSKLERQSVTWAYGGIEAGEAVVITWTDVIVKGVDAITGQPVYIIGQYREP